METGLWKHCGSKRERNPQRFNESEHISAALNRGIPLKLNDTLFNDAWAANVCVVPVLALRRYRARYTRPATILGMAVLKQIVFAILFAVIVVAIIDLVWWAINP
jgi:hypothetical protein